MHNYVVLEKPFRQEAENVLNMRDGAILIYSFSSILEYDSGNFGRYKQFIELW